MARSKPHPSRYHIIIDNWLRIVLWSSLWAIGWRLSGLVDYQQLTWPALSEFFDGLAMQVAAVVAAATVAGILHKKFGSFHVYTWLVHPSHVLAIGAGAGLAYGTSALEVAEPLRLLLAFMAMAALLLFTTSRLLGAPQTGYVPPSPVDSTSAYRLFEMGEPSKGALELVEEEDTWIGREESPGGGAGEGVHSGDPEVEQTRRRRIQKLLEWISNDIEVSSPEDDRFPRHGVVAYNMAMGLYAWIVSFADLSAADLERPDRTPNLGDFGDCFYSAALKGARGTGKSSILRLVEHHFRNFDALSFCYCEAGRYAGREALVVGILEQLLAEVRQFGDVMSLSQTPRKVWQEVGGGRLGLIASLVALVSPASQRERLDRLDQILIALDRFVVLVVEDLERFISHEPDASQMGREPGGSRSEGAFSLGALLMHIDEMERVSLVVATVERGMSALDQHKLIRRAERVPNVPLDDVATVVAEVRHENLCGGEPDGILGVVGPQAFGGGRDRLRHHRFIEDALADFGHPHAGFTAICKAIGSPRRMKSVLRRHRELWGRLRGEVDHDDLLALTALEFYRQDVYQLLAEQGAQIVSRLHSGSGTSAWGLMRDAAEAAGRAGTKGAPTVDEPPREPSGAWTENKAFDSFFKWLGHRVGTLVSVRGSDLQVVLGILHELLVQQGETVSKLLPSSVHRIQGFRPQAAFSPHPKYIDRMVQKQRVLKRSDEKALERGRALFLDLDKLSPGEAGVREIVAVSRELGNLSVVFSRTKWGKLLEEWFKRASSLEQDWIEDSDLMCKPILKALLVKRGSDDPLVKPREERSGPDNVGIDAIMNALVAQGSTPRPDAAVTDLLSRLREMDPQKTAFHCLREGTWVTWMGRFRKEGSGEEFDVGSSNRLEKVRWLIEGVIADYDSIDPGTPIRGAEPEGRVGEGPGEQA